MNTTNELENQILGVILTRPGTITEAMSLLPDSTPFVGANEKKVYAAMVDLHRSGYDTDIVSTNIALTKAHGPKDSFGLPWMVRLTTYTSAAKGAAAGLAYKCQIIWQEHCRVQTARLAQELLVEATEGIADGLTIVEQSIKRLTELQSRLIGLADAPFSAVLKQASALARQSFQTGTPPGLLTGLDELDSYLKGLQPSTLTVMAGRPGMGKTAEICQILYNVSVVQKKPAVLFSLEMSRLQLARRFLAIETGIRNAQVAAGCNANNEPIDFERLDKAVEIVGGSPIHVFDKLRTMPQIRSKAAQLKAKHGIELVVLDYLQLAKTGSRKDHDEYAAVTEISRECKEMANSLDIPVIALAQLSREVEKSPSKRPQLAHLRGTGAIEQDADNVVFLFRPAYYSAKDANGHPVDANLLINIVAKNRNGSTHNDEEGIQLFYDLPTNRITNMCGGPSI
ncbi:AAA family ATPase [Rudanella paleaurantiibacter]|uniref:DNA 5'-3' helicase n=1 Tax=Rudanella paleaurantiibacter TaxID=2614655 RepID=A0A7J5TZF1_9BACT|nr:DnaB-like helicase C-terminal domain-containing protein [Rudanella paleaurantiibacter]KAB7730483.1 AAA family ATPase [Rudanella paleaurantiibacter]